MRPDLKSRPYRVGGRGNLLASLLGIGVYAKYDSLEFRVLRADPPPLDVGCIAGIRDRRRGDPMWSPSWAGQPESGRPHGGAPTSGRSASSPLGMASIARIRINHRGLLCVLCGESALLRLAWGPSLKIKGTAETQRRRDRVLRPRAARVGSPENSIPVENWLTHPQSVVDCGDWGLSRPPEVCFGRREDSDEVLLSLSLESDIHAS